MIRFYCISIDINYYMRIIAVTFVCLLLGNALGAELTTK